MTFPLLSDYVLQQQPFQDGIQQGSHLGYHGSSWTGIGFLPGWPGWQPHKPPLKGPVWPSFPLPCAPVPFCFSELMLRIAIMVLDSSVPSPQVDFQPVPGLPSSPVRPDGTRPPYVHFLGDFLKQPVPAHMAPPALRSASSVCSRIYRFRLSENRPVLGNGFFLPASGNRTA